MANNSGSNRNVVLWLFLFNKVILFICFLKPIWSSHNSFRNKTAINISNNIFPEKENDIWV